MMPIYSKNQNNSCVNNNDRKKKLFTAIHADKPTCHKNNIQNNHGMTQVYMVCPQSQLQYNNLRQTHSYPSCMITVKQQMQSIFPSNKHSAINSTPL